MMRIFVKFVSIIIAMLVIMEHVQAAYLPEIEKNEDVTLTNQLNKPQKQLQQQQQQLHRRHQLQFEPISSDGATTENSYDTVRGDGLRHLALPHESYDNIDDVSIDGHDDIADSIMFNAEDNDNYENDVEELVEETFSRKKRALSDWFIAPNTRWCGRGNTADGNYNHLGGASAADKCCRRHDHCKMYIPGMSNRYELFNYRPYTLSHCSCDRRFRTCLKMANDEDAKTIGKLFFNMVQTQCFTIHKEEICHKHASDGTCENKEVKQKAFLRNNLAF